jgi:broad specificity polyphosphatase/5'/3'-nucleotidase SurE
MKCQVCKKARGEYFFVGKTVCESCKVAMEATHEGIKEIARNMANAAEREAIHQAEIARKAGLTEEELAAEDDRKTKENKAHNANVGKWKPTEDVMKKAYEGSG